MQELSLVAEYNHTYEKAYSKAYRAERATSVESGFDIEEAESRADYEAKAVAKLEARDHVDDLARDMRTGLV